MRKAMFLLAVFGLASLLFLLPLSAIAQTKASGTLECGKPDQVYEIKIPDQEGFVYRILQNKCTWPTSFTVEGLQSTYNLPVEFDEVMGAAIRITVTDATYYSNGDKTFHKTTGTYDPKTMTFSGKWTFTHGTGKLRGIKGGGTTICKTKSAESGGGDTCEVKGEYTLPPPRNKR